MARGFYNRGAVDPSWKRVRWLLSTSTEPAFFIEDLTQSPFNIGLRVETGAFGTEEVSTLARRHGLFLDAGIVKRILDYVGGHPYLTHVLLYYMAVDLESPERLFDVGTAGTP